MVLNMRKHRTILYAILTDFARQLSMPELYSAEECHAALFSLSCKAIVDTQFKSFNQNPCTILSLLHSACYRLDAMLWRLAGNFVGVTSFHRLLAWVLISAVPLPNP
jgi:hypothetical protein